MRQLATYSGSDLNLSISGPMTGGPILASGISARGIRSVTVRMTVDQSNLQVGMDGGVAPSVMPGDMGEVEIDMFQTSTLHNDMLLWWNNLKVAQLAGDVSEWFSATLLISNIYDGSSHTCTGVAPAKIPDKPYREQAQGVVWILRACQIVHEIGTV